MAETRLPVCSAKGCPAPSNPDWHIPWCGHALAGEHHHKPKRSQGGKKIVAFLCPECHAKTDTIYSDTAYPDQNGRLCYMLWKKNKDGTPGETLIHRYVDTGEVVGEGDGSVVSTASVQNACTDASPVPLPDHPPESQETPDDGHHGIPAVFLVENYPLASEGPQEDYEHPSITELGSYSDEKLATLYTDADKRQREGFLDKCAIIYAYRMRYEPIAGKDWLEAAYELFHVSRRTLYALSNVWEVCATSCTNIVEEVGPLTDSRSLMQFIGQKTVEDGCVALEAAVSYVAEFGEPPSVPALKHRLGEEAQDKAECAHVWLAGRMCSRCRAWEETG